jgi:hypothetical protein
LARSFSSSSFIKSWAWTRRRHSASVKDGLDSTQQVRPSLTHSLQWSDPADLTHFLPKRAQRTQGETIMKP